MIFHKQKGFSVIELMVAMVIGLVLMAGALSIFFSSRVTFSTNEHMARLQENGRVALDLVTHDIRSAGYNGCSRGVPFNNQLNTSGALLWNYVAPVRGCGVDWRKHVGAGAGCHAGARIGESVRYRRRAHGSA